MDPAKLAKLQASVRIGMWKIIFTEILGGGVEEG